jgi:hypothetical protein
MRSFPFSSSCPDLLSHMGLTRCATAKLAELGEARVPMASRLGTQCLLKRDGRDESGHDVARWRADLPLSGGGIKPRDRA